MPRRAPRRPRHRWRSWLARAGPNHRLWAVGRRELGAGVLGGHARVEQSGRAADGQLPVAWVVDRQRAGAVCVEPQAVAVDAKHPRLRVVRRRREHRLLDDRPKRRCGILRARCAVGYLKRSYQAPRSAHRGDQGGDPAGPQYDAPRHAAHRFVSIATEASRSAAAGSQARTGGRGRRSPARWRAHTRGTVASTAFGSVSAINAIAPARRP
jgi:hypothetical protein